jgi:hypothetical protein
MIQMKGDVVARILGSILVVAGWFLTLHTNVYIGSIVMTTGDCLALPWFIKSKAWDAVIMISFLSAVTVHKLLLRS